MFPLLREHQWRHVFLRRFSHNVYVLTELETSVVFWVSTISEFQQRFALAPEGGLLHRQDIAPSGLLRRRDPESHERFN